MDDVAVPSEFAHAGLRRVIGARDPVLEMLKVPRADVLASAVDASRSSASCCGAVMPIHVLPCLLIAIMSNAPSAPITRCWFAESTASNWSMNGPTLAPVEPGTIARQTSASSIDGPSRHRRSRVTAARFAPLDGPVIQQGWWSGAAPRCDRRAMHRQRRQEHLQRGRRGMPSTGASVIGCRGMLWNDRSGRSWPRV